MVQVLPYVPSFGERLAEKIGEAGTHIGAGLAQARQQKNDDAYFAIMQDPNTSPVQKLTAFSKLSEGRKKSVAPVAAAIWGPQAQAEAQTNQLENFKKTHFGTPGAIPQPVSGAPAGALPENNGLVGTSSNTLPNAIQTNNSSTFQGDSRVQALPPAQSATNQPSLNLGPASTGTPNPVSRHAAVDPENIHTWPEDKVALLASQTGSAGEMGKLELKRRKEERVKFTEDRTFHTKGSAKAVENAQALRESVPRKEIALNLAKDAVQSGEVGSFSLNNLAERFNLPELKTAKGSQLITAGKENLIGNLTAISAKAQNQWIEQRFNSMFPQIGQSEEANETIGTMLEANIEIDRAYLNAFNELEKKDIETYGYIRNDIDRRAHEIAESKQEEILNKSSYRLREIYEREKGPTGLQKNTNQKVPKGTPLTLQNAKVMSLKFDRDFDRAIEHAKKMGYRIPSNEEFERWQ